MKKTLSTLALAALALSIPASAHAFCGFYVSGAGAEMFNNATQVVLMREGTRTVLSMQNSYQGPPSDFAMVVPVPVVLQKESVKTLPPDIFDRVDKMASPRLVEYWEQDPCYVPRYDDLEDGFGGGRSKGEMRRSSVTRDDAPKVRIEAQFSVGEYEIVILSADDAASLDTWLRDNRYNIPKGAEAVLRPYIASGMKFFVAKVNARKVRFSGGKAVLSPLRFHYDTALFNLPVRLGLLNAKGHQDLIVHILARGRYQVANMGNVTIPTNIGVGADAKGSFGEFYAALFDRTLAQNPGAVVTEYAWAASSCDPCPGPTLGQADFVTLGADVMPSANDGGLVLTRLHARYTKDTLGEDLIFKAAQPILGGREVRKSGGELEQGAQVSSMNNFQGRYIIRHPWKGAVACQNPRRGIWGGPPGNPEAGPQARAAQNLADAPRGRVDLAAIVRQDIPEIGLKARRPSPPPPEPASAQPRTSGHAAACASAPGAASAASPWLLLALLAGLIALRPR